MELLERIERKVLNPGEPQPKLFLNGKRIKVNGNTNTGIRTIIQTKHAKNLEYKCCECQTKATHLRLVEPGTPKLVAGLRIMCDNGSHLTIDHIKPKSKGGMHSIHNYQLMCYECNSSKASYANNKIVRKVQITSDIFKLNLKKYKKPGKLKHVLTHNYFCLRKKVKNLLRNKAKPVYNLIF